MLLILNYSGVLKRLIQLLQINHHIQIQSIIQSVEKEGKKKRAPIKKRVSKCDYIGLEETVAFIFNITFLN